MIDLYIPLLAIVLGIASYLTVGWLRKVAIQRSVIDVPNERSSHSQPTPRGGGISIVLFGLLILASFAWSTASASLLGLAIGLALVGFIGVLDDQHDLSARLRMLVHIAATSIFIFMLGDIPPVNLFGLALEHQLILTVVSALMLLWLLNLYNFMDGINGIAAIQAMTTLFTVAVGAIVIGFGELTAITLLLIGVITGFLVWNFPQAKIFMGDAGSGCLGFMFAGLAMISLVYSEALFWVWLIALGVFIVDATLTLLTRLIRGQRVWEAHCSHAYQNAAKRWDSHVTVTCGVGLINCLWLGPIAVLVALGMISGLTGVLISYTPLVILALYLKAGRA